MFRDFTVRKSKVCRALLWLRENNPYYNDITIDREILESLPKNRSIFNMLPQIPDEQSEDSSNDIENEDETISRMFVPLLPLTHRENDAINETLNRIESNNPLITWPEIKGVPINEF